MKVKDVNSSAAKWAQRAGAATNDYAEGIQNPKNPWKESTAAGAENWKQATAKAANEGRFAKGVNAAGNDKWRDKSLSKGTSRFAQGVATGSQDYADGVAPYLAVIERTVLPQRKPKGDPANINRVSAIDTALHAAKNAKR